MAIYDSILNIDEWISDYFFSTDDTKGASLHKSVKARVAEWRAEAADTGAPTPLQVFASHRQAIHADPTSANARAALGYPPLPTGEGPASTDPDTTGEATASADTATTPTTFTYAGIEYQAPFTLDTRAKLATIDAHLPTPAGEGLDHAGATAPTPTHEDVYSMVLSGETHVGNKQEPIPVKRFITAFFHTHPDVNFIVIFAGQWVFLAHRSTWELGRYLAVNLAVVAQRNETGSGGETHTAVVALHPSNVGADATGRTWWDGVFELSIEHAVKVSAGLRQAIIESIEQIGNDVLTRRAHAGLGGQAGAGINGKELGNQALRYLYRILFVLFAESSPELQILPVGAPEYSAGYGMARIREFVVSPPALDSRTAAGTHLYQSLQKLFELIDKGHDGGVGAAGVAAPGLVFRNLSADLFQPAATALIDEVGLSNQALIGVLERLLLSPETKGRDRGFISYATLGVTELGQVYEGLMSYQGTITEEDVYEVADKGDASKGSWLLPVRMADTIPAASFVTEEVPDPAGGMRQQRKLYHRGQFAYRQSSRDRERSASFYTPQVLTEFTVSQAIEVLQQEGRLHTAADVLALSICEPAMGSGAFAVEAVRQLAELYLEKRQQELGETIAADARVEELQRVKAHIALHQVYGVDLNATAVELGEISLWLDTMVRDLKAPWFGLHLRRGNSLIGTRRAVYTPAQLKKRRWLKEVPAPLSDWEHEATGIHHFLLPAQGWAATADAKAGTDTVKEQVKALKAWRSSVRRALTTTQQKRLVQLARRVERLWQIALLRLHTANRHGSRSIQVWGMPHAQPAPEQVVSRAQIEADLFNNQEGAYNRLRFVMNAWCALWFWPLTRVPLDDATQQLPSVDEWLDMCEAVLGHPYRDTTQTNLFTVSTWNDINAVEDADRTFAQCQPMDTVRAAHWWLAVCEEVAGQQGFFHWDLDFANIMAAGGFDLQIGNPPWVRPRVDVDGLLAEADPWFALAHKPTQKAKQERTLGLEDYQAAMDYVANGVAETTATAAFLRSTVQYPLLESQQPDFYRGFMATTWRNMAPQGAVGLIHPESHFTEEKAFALRTQAYLHLRRHWEFINELMLFDVHHLVTYGVHVYGTAQEAPHFLNATRMYHPRTARDSLAHSGAGTSLPGLKDEQGNWDLRPHADRITTVTTNELQVWHDIMEEPTTPVLRSRMVYTVNSVLAGILATLSQLPRIGRLGMQYSSGWHETGARKAGYFEVGWDHPDTWQDAIVQGPHLGVSTPMIKEPNQTLKHNQDWREIDLEALPADYIPATGYQPDRATHPKYDHDFGTWTLANGQVAPVDSFYRVAWRRMAANTGFRTLYPALIPPGTKHVHTVMSGAAADSARDTVLAAAQMSSLVSDLFIRSLGKSDLFPATINGLPFHVHPLLADELAENYLRLNCLTEAYAPLWKEVTGTPWTPQTPARGARERWELQNRIDAMVAVSFGITAEELVTVYRTAFPVMARYDREDLYDANGRLVPKPVTTAHRKNPHLPVEDRTWVHPQSQASYVYEYPFAPLDRAESLQTLHAQYLQITQV